MLKPTIHKLKDLRGRRTVGYRATYAQYSADGSTPAEATERLQTLLDQVLANVKVGTRIWYWRGQPIVLAPGTYNDEWLYFLPDPDVTYQTAHGGYTQADAERSALHHLAQNVWTPETDDPTFLQSIPDARVRRKLAGWIGFQRAYIQIRETGDVPERERHERACQQGDLYAREHFGELLRATERVSA